MGAPAPVDVAALDRVLAPGTGCMLPSAAYLDEAVLAWERQHLFAGTWVCTGRVADLAERGARRAVVVGDDAVLLVRGDDGDLRGFYNVCRHRGHELVECGATTTGRGIRCPYHGWSYALDGVLSATPRFRPDADFDRADHGLVGVHVEEWHGWVMVDAGGDAPSVAEALDGIEPHVADHEPERLVVAASHTYELACNWKLVVENYQECVHCPSIHPHLCRVSPPASGVNHVGHPGAWLGGWMDLAPGAATMSLTGESPWTPLPRLSEAARRRVDYLVVLPNLLVSLHPDYVMTHRLEPLAPDRTAVECQWLFAPDTAASPGFDPAPAVEFWDVTNRQDWAACEAVQRGLRSRGFRPGPLSTAEDGVAQFTRRVASAYRTGSLVARSARSSGQSPP